MIAAIQQNIMKVTLIRALFWLACCSTVVRSVHHEDSSLSAPRDDMLLLGPVKHGQEGQDAVVVQMTDAETATTQAHRRAKMSSMMGKKKKKSMMKKKSNSGMKKKKKKRKRSSYNGKGWKGKGGQGMNFKGTKIGSQEYLCI